MTQPPSTSTSEHLARVIDLHFDPEWGTPYWLDRAAELGFDPRRDIRTVHDLPRLGLMQPSLLRSRPLEYFISKKALAERSRLIVVQTGGTLAAPVWTAYRDDEFTAAFVTPFVIAAGHVGFPSGRSWLYAGPSGPHVIGRAADAIARATGSPAPFSVDFDPRWARKLATGSFAAGRYLQHVVDQALDVVNGQDVGVLFSTPPVLEQLARRMTPTQRERIEGVHYGGMALSPADLERLQREGFPNAVHLAGYGNSLFGCAMELSVAAGRVPQYFPHGHRLLFGVVDDASENQPSDHEPSAVEEWINLQPRHDAGRTPHRANGTVVTPISGTSHLAVRTGHAALNQRAPEGATSCDDDQPRIRYDAPGQTGTIAFCRLDETVLLANVIERDTGCLAAPDAPAADGFWRAGVRAPTPTAATRTTASSGLY